MKVFPTTTIGMKRMATTLLAALILAALAGIPLCDIALAQHSVNQAYWLSKKTGEEILLSTGKVTSITKETLTIERVIGGGQISYKLSEDTGYFVKKTITSGNPRLGEGETGRKIDIRVGDTVGVLSKTGNIALGVVKGGVLMTLD